jgi:hypothetical protein
VDSARSCSSVLFDYFIGGRSTAVVLSARPDVPQYASATLPNRILADILGDPVTDQLMPGL